MEKDEDGSLGEDCYNVDENENYSGSTRALCFECQKKVEFSHQLKNAFLKVAQKKNLLVFTPK